MTAKLKPAATEATLDADRARRLQELATWQ
jgi:hypothetical protein